MTDIEEHTIYLIAHRGQDGAVVGPVKVGFTRYPEKRLASLQTGNPQRLVLLAQFLAPSSQLARHAEGVFHAVAKRDRMSGEWFAMSPSDALATLIKCVVAIVAEDVGNFSDADVLLSWSGLPKALKTLVDISETEKTND